MASMNSSSNPVDSTEQVAWNQAYDRLQNFLNTFMLSDHSEVSRLALKLLDQSRELHRQDPSRNPTTLVMEQTHKRLTEWLAANLDEQDRSPSQIVSSGGIALLLSRMPETAPGAFFTSPLSEDLRQSMRQALLVTGPDLKISSMTPRHIDYGPMLDLARQTWHRWNSNEVLIAMAFWAGVYFVFYWWLSDVL
jgi:hypothetical protein